MTTQDFILTLFCQVDDQMAAVPKRPDAKLYPSEVVTLALLFAIKGVGTRAFYRWLMRDYQAWFPHVPERTRLFRLFKTHMAWTAQFLAAPTVLGIADSYGIEFIHPMREGRSPHQIGKKGQSNHRWIVGGKRCFVLNQWGLVCAWDCATANVHEAHFHPLITQFGETMIVLTDTGVSREDRRSSEHESVSARDLEWTDAGGDDLLAVDHWSSMARRCGSASGNISVRVWPGRWRRSTSWRSGGWRSMTTASFISR